MTIGQLRKMYEKRAVEEEKIIASFDDQVTDLLELPVTMTAKQLAYVLQISTVTANRIMKQPDFYPAFKLGSQMRINRDALIDWLNQQCKRPQCKSEVQCDE